MRVFPCECLGEHLQLHITKHCAVSVSGHNEQHLTTPCMWSTVAVRACQVLQQQPAKRLPAKQPRRRIVGNMRAKVICLKDNVYYF